MNEVWTWLKAHPKGAAIGGGVAVALLVGSFAAGRFAAPTKVLETERVVERLVVDEKVVAQRIAQAQSEWEKNVQDHTVTKIEYRDGKVVEKIIYVDRDSQSSGGTTKVEIQYVDREKVVFQDREVVKEKLVERDCPRVTLLGSVGAQLAAGTLGPPAWGLEGNGRVWGPLVIGLGGEGNSQYLAGRVLFGGTF